MKLVSTLIFWALSTSAWLFVNLLAALGLLLGLFILMANASWQRFFVEADNLARHYLAADAAAQADFARCVVIALCVISALLCLTRYPALLGARQQSGRHASDRADIDGDARNAAPTTP